MTSSIPRYKPTPCKFCKGDIFLYNQDLGEFTQLLPFEFSTGRRHRCFEGLQLYQQQQQQDREYSRQKNAILSTVKAT